MCHNRFARALVGGGKTLRFCYNFARGGTGLDHDAAQVTQEALTLEGPLNQDAAAVGRIDLTAGQIQLTKPVQRTGDRRL